MQYIYAMFRHVPPGEVHPATMRKDPTHNFLDPFRKQDLISETDPVEAKFPTPRFPRSGSGLQVWQSGAEETTRD